MPSTAMKQKTLRKGSAKPLPPIPVANLRPPHATFERAKPSYNEFKDAKSPNTISHTNSHPESASPAVFASRAAFNAVGSARGTNADARPQRGCESTRDGVKAPAVQGAYRTNTTAQVQGRAHDHRYAPQSVINEYNVDDCQPDNVMQRAESEPDQQQFHLLDRTWPAEKSHQRSNSAPSLKNNISSTVRSLSPRLAALFSPTARKEKQERKAEAQYAAYEAEVARAAQNGGFMAQPNDIFDKPKDFAKYLRRKEQEKQEQVKREQKFKEKISRPVPAAAVFDADYFTPADRHRPTYAELGLMPPMTPTTATVPSVTVSNDNRARNTTFGDFIEAAKKDAAGKVGSRGRTGATEPYPKFHRHQPSAWKHRMSHHKKKSSLTSLFSTLDSPLSFECAGPSAPQPTNGGFECYGCGRPDTANVDGFGCAFCKWKREEFDSSS